jgi:succinyl-diaminopimelate desuccinylase
MNDQSLINTLIDLLKIKSLTGFEEDIKNYIFDYIKNIINNDQSICIYQKRNNVVVYHDDLPKENVIAFIGHIDTVDNINEYNAKLIDGKIYGLGSSDMKSGVAIILNLFKIFYNLNNIIWIFYDQEEGPYINNGLNILFKDLKELLSKIDLAIILEPTNNYIELGCNGVMNIEVFVKGKSGHSARPYSYINPFYKLTNLLINIQNFFKNEFKLFLNDYGISYNQEIVFKSNCVITDIKGMISKSIENKFKNVVPEYAKVNINIRFTPDFNKLKLIKIFSDFFYKIFYKENFIVRVVDYAPPGKIIINDMFKNLVNFYISYDSIFCTKGIKVKEAWTDVATFTNQNISALNLGPGDPSLAHTKNEYVLTQNLTDLFEFFVSFLNEFRKINLF